jgi:hypothetical protein
MKEEKKKERKKGRKEGRKRRKSNVHIGYVNTRQMLHSHIS